MDQVGSARHPFISVSEQSSSKELPMRTTTKLLMAGLVGLVAIGSYFAEPAKAQVPSSNPPYNVDLGALITNTAQTPATVNSAQQTNLDKEGVICTFNATLSSGSPSVTLNLQNFDSASGNYYTIVTGGAVTAFSYHVPLSIIAHTGAQTGAGLPPSVLSAAGIPLARLWRIQEVIGGSSVPATTSTVGCNWVK
jgi:hypothetical protein